MNFSNYKLQKGIGSLLRRPVALLLMAVFLFAGGAWAQSSSSGTDLSGRIVDSNGEPLAGANVFIQGKSVGTTADIDGRYTIKADKGDTVVFSYIGFAEQSVVYQGQTTLDVALEDDATALGEVVVVGYGTQRKVDVTGSISSVRKEDLATTVAAANPLQAIQGKIAGVEVVSSNAPGGAPQVRVRGVGSFRNSDPCYVVDGLIMSDIAFLNPAEIESIEVLKDASATAIYGSRGANGVIIVTTKQGRKEEKARVSVNANVGVSQISNYVDVADASQYLRLQNMVVETDNIVNGTGNPLPYANTNVGRGTDWQSEVTRLAVTQNYQVNVLGGTKKSTYGLSAGYFDQDGVLKNSLYRRANVKLSNTYDLASFITLGSNISFTYERRTGEPGSMLSSSLHALPTAHIMDPDDPSKFYGPVSELGKYGNPVANLYYHSENFNNYYKTIANFFVNVNILKNLVLRSTFTLENANNEGKSFYPEFQVNTEQYRAQSELNVSQGRSFNWLNENTLTYTLEKGRHRFSAVAGITFQQNKGQSQSQNIKNMPDVAWKNRDLWYTGLGDKSTLTGSTDGHNYTYFSWLARANYSFADKYMITATVRMDASSRFPVNGRYGTFPAVGLGWRMKEENWLKDVSWLTNLKLRASYGVVGSDAGIPNNIQTAYTNRVDGVFGQDPDSVTTTEVLDMVVDYGLRWEEAKQLDLGFEFGAFRNRLTLEFDYYNKTTSGILTEVTMPGVSGTTYRPLSNIATTRNSGVEFNLAWADRVSDNFSYNLSLIGSTLKNEVVSVNQDLPPIENGPNRTLVGYPVGGFWGYEVIGIYQNREMIDATAHFDGAQPGDLWYKDNVQDGKIDENDRIYMGSYLPKATLGLNFGFQWGGFDFSMDWYSSLGNKVYNMYLQSPGVNRTNVHASALDAWTGPGSTNTRTRVLLENGTTNDKVSQYYLQDGSYLKLRNVVLGYSLPRNVVSKIRLSGIRFYIAGNNLLTISKVTGFTPELSGGPNEAGRYTDSVYPSSRMYTFGVNIDI